MKLKISTLLVLATIILFTSCRKSDVIGNETDVAGTWQVVGIRSDMANDWDGDGYSETDILSTYSSCGRDIVLVFDDYGTGQSREGCNASWRNLNWQLLNGNRTLHIDLLSDAIDLNNLQASYSSIRGEDRVYSNGRYYNVTYTLQRR